ncbi:MAG: Wzz/FepE/Etk N-terminal domain-containing protein [Candidatus Omnitrophota bacterium]
MESNQSMNLEQTLTLRDYLQVIFRQKAVVLVCLITVILTAYVGLKLQTKYYQADVKMLITAQKQVEAPYYKESYDTRNVEQTLTQSEIVKSNPVLMRVVMAQGLHKRPPLDEKKFASSLKNILIDIKAKLREGQMDTVPTAMREQYRIREAIENLRASVKVNPIRDTNMFTISVLDYNPIGAAILANTVSRSYIIFDLEQQLSELRLKYGEGHPKVAYVRDNIAAMEKTLDGQPLDDVTAIGPASVKVVEQAMVPIKPTGSSKSLTFLLAIMMGCFLGIMLAFIFEYADQTVKTPRDIDQALGIPCLGSIRNKRLWASRRVDFQKKLTAYAYSYQMVCDQLYLLWKEKNVASIMVASTLKTENNPLVIANMSAYITTKLERKVLVIDADFHAPMLHKTWKLDNAKGLVDYLLGKSDLKSITHVVNDKLSVIPAGVTAINPILLYESGKMADLLTAMKKNFDTVIIRSSALRNHRDPAILAKYTDGVLVVIEDGKVRKQVMQAAFADLKALPHKNWGALIVNRNYPIPRWIYNRI